MQENLSTTSQKVAEFYDKHGWTKQDADRLGEDILFRIFPAAEARYSAQATERVYGLLSAARDSVLFAGCGDMPEHHLRIARAFKDVTCIDISATALGIARDKLGTVGSYVHESVVKTTLPDNAFDTVYCAYVIFHINASEQETAIRQLVRVTKPGGRVLILYANPKSPFAMPGESVRRLKRWLGLGRRTSATPELYYHAYPRGWWRRFEGHCNVSFVPSDVIGSRPARALLKSDRMASGFYERAAWVETHIPQLAVRLWQYQVVVLEKR